MYKYIYEISCVKLFFSAHKYSEADISLNIQSVIFPFTVSFQLQQLQPTINGKDLNIFPCVRIIYLPYYILDSNREL